MEYRFQIGDKVVVTDPKSYFDNNIGTVVAIDVDDDISPYTVAFLDIPQDAVLTYERDDDEDRIRLKINDIDWYKFMLDIRGTEDDAFWDWFGENELLPYDGDDVDGSALPFEELW